jgi:hypothetical protein
MWNIGWLSFVAETARCHLLGFTCHTLGKTVLSHT